MAAHFLPLWRLRLVFICQEFLREFFGAKTELTFLLILDTKIKSKVKKLIPAKIELFWNAQVFSKIENVFSGFNPTIA